MRELGERGEGRRQDDLEVAGGDCSSGEVSRRREERGTAARLGPGEGRIWAPPGGAVEGAGDAMWRVWSGWGGWIW